MKRELSDFRPLRPGEAEYVEKLAAEDWDAERFVRIGDGKLPDEGDAARTLRGDFVRFLALGGGPGAAPPETGLRLRGGLIEGELSVEGCRDLRDVELTDCRFDAAPILRGASVNLLILSRSVLPGLRADRLETRGGVFLRGSRFSGEARLAGARIGGDLSCQDARFASGKDKDVALTCDGARVEGNVNLTAVVAQGQISFAALEIRRSLVLSGGRFVRPARNPVALRLDGASVEGTLFQRSDMRPRRPRREVRFQGVVELTAARLGTINDDPGSWPERRGALRLDRCTYGAFTGGRTPVDADSRLAWLDLHDPATVGADFQPQPYEQLAKVLRETGHAEDARRVLIAKEAKQRAARRARASAGLRPALWIRDQLLRVTVRYGRVPTLAFAWLFGLWILGAAVFHDAAEAGAMKPNNPFILRSPEWAFCAHPDGEAVIAREKNPTGTGRSEDGHRTRIDCFLAQPEAQPFPRFDVWAYSADTLFPLVDLEMQDHWIPDETHSWPYAEATRAYLWIHVGLGWALSLLAVAGFSGIAKSD
ncbi:MAG TPA: hypothetical protein VJ994_01575 [Paracoccaceae bacterium]|nr:hypothetical protein [Paracoccaceae bacterium]